MTLLFLILLVDIEYKNYFLAVDNSGEISEISKKSGINNYLKTRNWLCIVKSRSNREEEIHKINEIQILLRQWWFTFLSLLIRCNYYYGKSGNIQLCSTFYTI